MEKKRKSIFTIDSKSVVIFILWGFLVYTLWDVRDSGFTLSNIADIIICTLGILWNKADQILDKLDAINERLTEIEEDE